MRLICRQATVFGIRAFAWLPPWRANMPAGGHWRLWRVAVFEQQPYGGGKARWGLAAMAMAANGQHADVTSPRGPPAIAMWALQCLIFILSK